MKLQVAPATLIRIQALSLLAAELGPPQAAAGTDGQATTASPRQAAARQAMQTLQADLQHLIGVLQCRRAEDTDEFKQVYALFCRLSGTLKSPRPPAPPPASRNA